MTVCVSLPATEGYVRRLPAPQGEGEEMGRENQRHPESQGTDQPTLEISHLKRREIQAPVAAYLIRGFASVMGQDKAVEVATAAVQADAMKAGRIMAEKYGSNTLAKEHLSFNEPIPDFSTWFPNVLKVVW